MSKVEFKIVDNDFQVVKSTNDKYLLLSLFIGQFRFRDNIQEIIDLLESVRNESKTWLEANDDLMFMQIGYMCGDFKCNKDTAYFIADNSTSYQDLEMPLQEVINLMKDWKAF
ncbi:hypothetical protein [Chryseobacterium luquanense]|uniref:Uncharacterized protein n=1 Tax=Chryseobacterium luquanense TaxID=2983766 RepID=A0ABT3Y5V8_9FLAO|nr:hypothetical protein [Chryseobacterium luquanense]MCX8533513.1 hypothetical protein [Chryseobacterium luquanense]